MKTIDIWEHLKEIGPKKMYVRGEKVFVYDVSSDRYIVASPSTAKQLLQRRDEHTREMRLKYDPKCIAEANAQSARAKAENDAFWQEFAITFRAEALITNLRDSNDPRLEEILKVGQNGFRQYFREGEREQGVVGAEMARGQAILNYVEGNHPDLYGFLQRACPWAS